MMVCDPFAASGPGRLAIADVTKKSALCRKILNVLPLFHEMKPKRTWVMVIVISFI